MPQAQPVQQPIDAATSLIEDIRRRLPGKVTAEEAIQAVMCTFSQHVSGQEASEVFSSLPERIKPLLERCMIHRGERAESFGRDQLVVRVADHLGLSLEEAEQVASSVLDAIRTRLPQHEVAAVAAQLPAELVELWVMPDTRGT